MYFYFCAYDIIKGRTSKSISRCLRLFAFAKCFFAAFFGKPNVCNARIVRKNKKNNKNASRNVRNVRILRVL